LTDGPSHPVATPSGLADTVIATPANQSMGRSLAELAGSMLLAACVAGMLGLVWEVMIQPGDAVVMEFVALATACSWCVLVPAKIWVNPADDSWPRRVIMAGLGVALGLGDFWLHGQPLGDAIFSPSSEARVELLKYLGFFGLAFFLMRWWMLAERRRPVRFDFGAVLVTGILLYVLSFLLPPGASHRHIVVLALTVSSAIVQLVSPWERPLTPPLPRHRLRFS
jgi:hypothetical protein